MNHSGKLLHAWYWSGSPFLAIYHITGQLNPIFKPSLMVTCHAKHCDLWILSFPLQWNNHIPRIKHWNSCYDTVYSLFQLLPLPQLCYNNDTATRKLPFSRCFAFMALLPQHPSSAMAHATTTATKLWHHHGMALSCCHAWKHTVHIVW